MRIMIDPGHGGKDVGATNKTLLLMESRVTLSYALLLRSVLDADKHSAAITRYEDVYIPLPQRVEKAKDFASDVLVSLHCNASNNNAEGIEVWTSPGQTESDELATILYEEIEKEFPDKKLRKDIEDGDPDREARFYVLRKTPMPAVLIELGFLTNDVEANWLRDFGTLQAYCQLISRSLSTWGKWRETR